MFWIWYLYIVNNNYWKPEIWELVSWSLEEVVARQRGQGGLTVQQPTDCLVPGSLRLWERSEAPPVSGAGLHLTLVQQETNAVLVALSSSQVQRRRNTWRWTSMLEPMQERVNLAILWIQLSMSNN